MAFKLQLSAPTLLCALLHEVRFWKVRCLEVSTLPKAVILQLLPFFEIILHLVFSGYSIQPSNVLMHHLTSLRFLQVGSQYAPIWHFRSLACARQHALP